MTETKLSELVEAAREAVDVLYAEGLVRAARNLEVAVSEACRTPKVYKRPADRNLCDWCSAPAGIERNGSVACEMCSKEEPE